MAWENIEERLKKVLKVEISFPSGTVWLPDAHVTIDEWLTSLAQTDEELEELNIPRIRFLQNRWRVENLLRIDWEKPVDRRTILVMYVGREAYLLFSGGSEYHLIAAIAPNNRPALYRAVIGRLLQNPSFVPGHPISIKSHRPDLVPEVEIDALRGIEAPSVYDDTDAGAHGGSLGWMQSASPPGPRKGYLSKLLVGWIGEWIDLPVLGFWHEDVPDSIAMSERGRHVMKYEPKREPVPDDESGFREQPPGQRKDRAA